MYCSFGCRRDTKSVQDEAPLCMTCTDDMVLVDENTNILEGKIEGWREILKKNRLKINGVITKFLDFEFKNKAGEIRRDHNIRLKKG